MAWTSNTSEPYLLIECMYGQRTVRSYQHVHEIAEDFVRRMNPGPKEYLQWLKAQQERIELEIAQSVARDLRA